MAKFFDANGISVLPWPAQSPNLNPIENLRGIMKRLLRKRTKYPSNREDLFSQVFEIWSSLPNEYFIKLSQSMIRRCNTISNVNGRSCKY